MNSPNDNILLSPNKFEIPSSRAAGHEKNHYHYLGPLRQDLDMQRVITSSSVELLSWN